MSISTFGVRHPSLKPGRIGDLELANRLAVSPMTRVSATPDGTPTQEMAGYYAELARGGFGLVITEGTYTDTLYSQGYLNQPGIVSEAHVAAWRETVDRVHAAGAPIVLQLMHAGALSQGSHYRKDTAGPSAVPPLGEKMPEYGGHGRWATPREMNPADIEKAVRGFVISAVNAREAGFDGIEVHGANGYLLDQFLTDYTNRRDDSYGGPIANRVRLAAEVVAAIRAEVGSSFCVGIRLSQTKVNDFGHRWPGGAHDAEVVFTALADAGATYLHIASEGRDWIETARLAGGATITGLARRVSGLPVIANGGMHEPAQAAQVLADGHADVLSVGRWALANPDLPRRLAEGAALEDFDHMMVQPMATLDNTRRWRAAGARAGV
ncbi:2,4-dienoyl-CoA reductase [Streptosporangium subroseum]|uniref:2,4-dienoyl-CoA reductase n=1 Tax=Streptosporangium subroseum TaxID=106412 RepID=A0A239LXH1_9ACTN|nr:NADH:flavin oxidoreductase [Streptosporangium subroseum]SNT34503.1 2,4-dienoyl-CoA reductase [Streptosporangium subroseum]